MVLVAVGRSESWRVLALNLPTRYMSCHTCGFGLSLAGTVRRCSERLTPSVQAHPELFTPDGCGSPLPGRTMPPAPRPHVRAARATGLSFLRGLVCEPEVVLSRNHSRVRCFCASVSGPPEGKETGLFPASTYGRRLKARVVPFGRTLLVPLPICSPRPAGADQAV